MSQTEIVGLNNYLRGSLYYQLMEKEESQIVALKPYTGRVPACGVFCGGCPVYVRDKKRCPGAQVNKVRCEKCKTFHLCCQRKGISHCFQCNVFPCSKFKSFTNRWLKYGQNFINNQALLKDLGEEGFLEHFNNRVE